MQRLTHFTDFVIAHSHLTVFGTFILWVTAGMYYVIPRLAGRELYSNTLAQWHYWLTVAGFSLMAAVLTLQGLLQGTMLQVGADFVDSMVAMKPYWFTRTLAGVTMDIGAILGMWNFYMTVVRGGASRPASSGDGARAAVDVTQASDPVATHEAHRADHPDRGARLLRARHDDAGHPAVARQGVTRPTTVKTIYGNTVSHAARETRSKLWGAGSTSARAAGIATRNSCGRSIATRTSGGP